MTLDECKESQENPIPKIGNLQDEPFLDEQAKTDANIMREINNNRSQLYKGLGSDPDWHRIFKDWQAPEPVSKQWCIEQVRGVSGSIQELISNAEKLREWVNG